MRRRLGPNSGDPIMGDIYAARNGGHFDQRRDEGPSKLEMTSVEDLKSHTSTMSPERRKMYLAQIGRVRHGRTTLSGKKESGPRRSVWLSR